MLTGGTHPVTFADDGTLAYHGGILRLLSLVLEVCGFDDCDGGWQDHR